MRWLSHAKFCDRVEVDGATHRVEVDAGARAAALRVDPTNRELAIRTDHASELNHSYQARRGRAEDVSQVAVHDSLNNNTIFKLS